MKNLSRILTVLLCFAPVAYASAGPVATTAGSNLTAFNPSNANNNQWATMSNGRYDSANAPTAKVDFGNCNALILRCAQPKCGNGGCSDLSVASAIVNGCVQSNSNCKQYGNDLIQYMSAQLVANSNAKINEQNLAAQQAAAAAAQQQSEQQMQQMQYQMQQMQQQMAQQQAESQQQLQEALAQQAAQNAAALESMKTAATDAAKESEAGLSAYQQEAIDRGVSADVIERQTITGQIMTEIENAETSLKEVKVAMNNAFEYAKCDSRGNNCKGPKRVKKWRELATDFLDPYDNTIDKIYDALIIAQTVGVDLSQIYMMLNNSCNSWGQYLCPQMTGGQIVYTDPDSTSKGVPQVCPAKRDCLAFCDSRYGADQFQEYSSCKNRCDEQNKATGICKPCTMIKLLTESNEDQEAVWQGWVDAEKDVTNGNVSVVACASGTLNSSKLFARRTRSKNGVGLVDIDKLDTWLNQVEPSKKYGTNSPELVNYCNAKETKALLERSVLSKVVPTSGAALCVRNIGETTEDKAECAYISPTYAICDAHQYNAGISNNADLKSEDVGAIKEIIGLKTTVVSQQMYKQYEYLNATLRRLKTQLEKAALTTKLETAGAKTEGGSSSSSGLLGSSSNNDDKTIHLPGANNCSNLMDFDSAYNCLQNNVALIKSNIASNTKKACLQLQETVISANAVLSDANKTWKSCKDYAENTNSRSCKDSSKDKLRACADEINFAVMKEKRDQSQQNKKFGQQP